MQVPVNLNDSSVINLGPSKELKPSLSTVGSINLLTNERNAPVFYVYNESNPSQYVSLYISDGKPHFQYRLDQSVEEPIGHVMVDKEINDNRWHQVNFERVGRRSKLSVKSLEEKDSEAKTNQESINSVVFNIDPNGAKFVLGQFPSSNLPAELNQLAETNNQFRGALNAFNFNGHSYGLWNYDSAVNIKGEMIEKRFEENDKTTVNSLYFKEDSFICTRLNSVAQSFQLSYRYSIELKIEFKTEAPDGLLWYWTVGNDQYIAVYLENGLINLEVSQTSDVTKNNKGTTKRLNDNKFHSLKVLNVILKCFLVYKTHKIDLNNLVKK